MKRKRLLGRDQFLTTILESRPKTNAPFVLILFR